MYVIDRVHALTNAIYYNPDLDFFDQLVNTIPYVDTPNNNNEDGAEDLTGVEEYDNRPEIPGVPALDHQEEIPGVITPEEEEDITEVEIP